MATTERIQRLYERVRQRPPQTVTFTRDYHRLAATKYADLPTAEAAARAMAEAIVSLPVLVEDDDRLAGRIYMDREVGADKVRPDLNTAAEPRRRIAEELPDFGEMVRSELTVETAIGHITWNWEPILRLGTSGMKEMYRAALRRAADEKAAEFYRGVLLMLDAMDEWNARHVAELRRRGMEELARVCEKVPAHPAETFREAVQAFYFQHIVVMRENPYGGNGPGRLDYYLWPYLKRDLGLGRCTLDEAKELVDELFLRIEERFYNQDGFVEAIVVGGSHPDGSSAVNPLSHLMVRSLLDLKILHPSIYLRFPKDVPDDFVALAAEYLKSGCNRAQVLNDEAVTAALMRTGVPYQDAVQYACGGCMEVGVQGMQDDFLYQGWQNLPKLFELTVTGGVCLRTGKQYGFIRAQGLERCRDFEEFYRAFLAEHRNLLHTFFRAQDLYNETARTARPAYLLSSMIGDCLLRGRNLHDGGARYNDYGSSPVGLPNVADELIAVKKAVFDDKICTAAQLVAAMKANYEGYEELRKRLCQLPKYGQENPEANEMMRRLCADVSRNYTDYRTAQGGTGKMVVLTFIYSPIVAKSLGATADGGFAGRYAAHGVTPQSCAMDKGITAAINSCGSVPFDCFNGAASTMWDLDPAYATPEVCRALLLTFFSLGGQIYQGNTTDVEQMRLAQLHPEEHKDLIVRVGGFSARFVSLEKSLQDEIIARVRHGR